MNFYSPVLFIYLGGGVGESEERSPEDPENQAMFMRRVDKCKYGTESKQF